MSSDSIPTPSSRPRGGIPRGLDHSGPAILSYGFRPFFFAAGLYYAAQIGLSLLLGRVT